MAMQTFTKAERLCSKAWIDQLVGKGKSYNSFPFKVFWLEIQENIAFPQIVISVPKRSFKKAVVRNRIKRLIREGYRKNKIILYDRLNNKKILFMFIYTAKTVIEYKEIEERIIATLNHLVKEINK